jgi:hypothetical protein
MFIMFFKIIKKFIIEINRFVAVMFTSNTAGRYYLLTVAPQCQLPDASLSSARR